MELVLILINQVLIMYILMFIGYMAYKRKLFKDNGNGKFISNIKNGYVVSMYFHKTKVHTATCDGGVLGGGTISAIADPGEWAIAYCKAGISGRRTYYNHF